MPPRYMTTLAVKQVAVVGGILWHCIRHCRSSREYGASVAVTRLTRQSSARVLRTCNEERLGQWGGDWGRGRLGICCAVQC